VRQQLARFDDLVLMAHHTVLMMTFSYKRYHNMPARKLGVSEDLRLAAPQGEDARAQKGKL
jgi:hypothetical protein